ncbi:MAG: calcium-binding protein, partial [Pseudomonadota bacterium]
GAGGSSAGDRIEAAGYDNWRTWGENLSYRGGGNVRTVDVVEGHHDGLFRSPGHRRNLMNDRFSEIGIGQEYGEFRGVNASMVTQKFASDFGDPFLVGVVYDDRDGDGFFDPGEELSGVRVTVSGEGSATTGPGGGYELRVDGGETYTVTFSGGELGRTISRTVRVDDENEKLDLIASPGGTGGGGSGGGASGDAEPESRVVEGDAGDDVVRTGGGDDTVSGRLGHDEISGGRGADRLVGGGGDDTLIGGAGADRLLGQSGDDRLLGGAGADTLNGGRGEDVLKGGAGGDRLLGKQNADRLAGGRGEDALFGGGGDDWLNGGAGGDRLVGGAAA